MSLRGPRINKLETKSVFSSRTAIRSSPLIRCEIWRPQQLRENSCTFCLWVGCTIETTPTSGSERRASQNWPPSSCYRTGGGLATERCDLLYHGFCGSLRLLASG
ncbi:hypothetical protein HZ326_8159 [Fusarium oxysporum f. sp. albedinis]|nr:hypothetical protein HZ326_8159 [Fusarium oxysporum f. sp. albedinis]